MNKRIHDDNIIWICCCCGCLPILGLIKGAIIVGPIFIISTISFSGIAIILLPHNIFLTYKALFKTSIIGINLKIIYMLLLPIPLLFWPILVIVSSPFFGFIYGLFYPVVLTFDEDYNLIYGGCGEVFIDIFNFIKSFWKYNYHEYLSYLKEIGNRKVEKTFDISIIQIIIGILLAIYGASIGVVALMLMWLIKFIPSIFRMIKFICHSYCEQDCLRKILYFIYMIIGLYIVPFASILSIIGYIGYGLYGGIYCAIEGYVHNIGRGFISIFNTVRECDLFTNFLIFEKDYSCLPDYSECCLKKKESNSENRDREENQEKKLPEESNLIIEKEEKTEDEIKQIEKEEKIEDEINLIEKEEKTNQEKDSAVKIIVDEK